MEACFVYVGLVMVMASYLFMSFSNVMPKTCNTINVLGNLSMLIGSLLLHSGIGIVISLFFGICGIINLIKVYKNDRQPKS